MNHHTIPAGHRMDSQGRLVPEANIKAIDKLRDELVREIFAKAETLHKAIADFKLQAFADIAAFVEVSAAQYGANLGGKKGNITLHSFDGELRINRAIAEHIQFDERLQAAKDLVDQCLRDWIEGSRPEVTILINDAFRVDQEGQIRTAAILALRRIDIQDVRWNKAMEAIGEAVTVIGTKPYLRFYKRDGNSQYKAVSLDIAGV